MADRDSAETPIACTLGSGAFQDRLAWIADLNRAALRDARRDGTRLILTYRPEDGDRVREMVRRERQCCAFLAFEMNDGANGMTLTVEAPEVARDALDAVFDPFLSGSLSDASCGCSTKTAAK